MIRRILVVCCGNTCRSPMAAALLGQMFGNEVEVQSAGIDTAEGLPASRDAVSAMGDLGIDISAHRSRDIANLELAAFDVVVALAPDIAGQLRAVGVELDKLWQLNIPDPYCKGIDVYRSTAKAMSVQLRRLSEKLLEIK